MRALIQRVSRCTVRTEGGETGSIGPGLLILLGVRKGDSEEDARSLARRTSTLRVFSDRDGKMNVSLHDAGGSAMIVSQFTLYGDATRGLRPSYSDAAPPEIAEHLYNLFVHETRAVLGHDRVATGVFRAMMEVELVNDGPVTLLVESRTSEGAPL